MPADVTKLLEKSESDLQQFVRATESDHLQSLFTQMWDAIRQVNLFGGQARSAASTEALVFSQLAMTVATYSNSESLRADAHRMMAYVLNANEQYSDA